MVKRCAKCGQTVLQTDIVCWHCGAQQTGTDQEGRTAPEPNGQKEVESTIAVSVRNSGNTAVSEEPPLSLTAVAVYAAITIFCFIIILLILQYLSRQPIFLINPTISREEGWQAVTDGNKQFTVDIPPNWTYLENENNLPVDSFVKELNPLEAQTVFQNLEENLAGDIVPYMLVQTNAYPAFLLITGSPGLQPATSTQLTALIEHSDWEILRIDEVELPQNENRIDASFYLDANGDQLRCALQMTPHKTERFVVVGCAPKDDFQQVAEVLTKMMLLFQPLIYQ